MEVFLQFGHSKLRLSGENFGLSGHTKGFVLLALRTIQNPTTGHRYTRDVLLQRLE